MMHNAILSFLLLLTDFCGSAQESPDIALIRSLTFKKPYPNYTYVQQSADLSKPYYIKRLTRQRFYEKTGKDSTLVLTLSKEETRYVLKQVALNKNYAFPKGLLPPSTCVGKDTLFAYVKHQNKKHYDEMMEVFKKGNQEASEKYRETHPDHYMAGSKSWVNYFSKPIYLRNGNIVLISSGYYCGDDCGCYDTGFYQKTKTGWIPLVMVSSGCD